MPWTECSYTLFFERRRQNSHEQGVDYQISSRAIFHCPAHCFAREQIDGNGHE